MSYRSTTISIIPLLRRELISSFGRNVNTSRDCMLLSQDIYLKISEQISTNTLRRLFGLVNTGFSPSQSTLAILCRYCGFETIDDLLQRRFAQSPTKPEGPDGEILISYLVSFFQSTPAKEYTDETFLAIVKNTLLFLKQYPKLRERFQRAIAKTPLGQEFYYEQFINIDELNSFYGEGLRFYLLEKRTSYAQIFGYALLCLKAWLTDNKKDVRYYHDEVMGYRLTKDMHPALCSRYFATQLYHADIWGKPVEKILIAAQKCHATFSPKAGSYLQFPGFEYAISFALIVTGYYEEALYYIRYSHNYYTAKLSYLDIGYYQSLLLIEAFALARLGRIAEAEAVYKTIQPSQFYILSRKAKSIIYLHLEKTLNKKVPDYEERIRTLVQETGFTRLNAKTQ